MSSGPAGAGDTFGHGLFGVLRAAAGADWAAYVDHEFVRRLGDGTLPQPCFRHYLVQDYLFLIQFSRAWALAGYKADTLDELRAAARAMSALLDREMDLHVGYCAGWGIAASALEQAPEARATIAYTRFVLERGLAGDLVDLLAALAPCVVGYAEIGARLAASPALVRTDNPYLPWITLYAGDDYQKVAAGMIETLERAGRRRGAAARHDQLAATFRTAVRLEADFWQMGLDQAA